MLADITEVPYGTEKVHGVKFKQALTIEHHDPAPRIATAVDVMTGKTEHYIMAGPEFSAKPARIWVGE